MSTHRQVCTFTLDDMLLGVDVRDVQEVIRFQEMTDVPLAPREVMGLINLRGQIVTAIDLRRRLALPERASEILPTNVVVRVEGGVVSFLVDEIGDVVEVDESSFERPPETLSGPAREFVCGVYKLKSSLLLLLDGERAAETAESTRAEAAA